MIYSVAEYVDDLRRITKIETDESKILAEISPLAQKLSEDTSWITPKLYETNMEQGFMAHMLHEEQDHSLAVFALNWLPHRGAPPHDHGTWAVIVGVDGFERNVRFNRTDDGSRHGHATLEVKDEFIAGPGGVVCMRSGGIHSVHNDGDHVSLSLHTYGRHVNYTERSQFDLENNTASVFKVAVG